MRVRIIGMGALGIMYAEHIRKYDRAADVAFVMDADRVRKYQGQTVLCNGKEQSFCMEEFQSCQPAELLIVAVKYNSLPSVIEAMEHCVGKETIIMSVMNGIVSEDMIAKSYGKEKLIYTVAQGMDAMKFGRELKYTQMGQLVIGARYFEQQKNVETVAAYFDEIQMPYQKESKIMNRLWGKFMLNVGVNQTCMVYQTNYAGVLREGVENEVMVKAMNEVISLANAQNIPLTAEDRNYFIELLRTLDPEGVPSMAQDRLNGRYSEVEMFAGTVIALGKEYGIATPVNEMLYKKVKEIEADY